MHSSGDTDGGACLVSDGQFAWFLMCALLVIQTVTCLVSVGKLVQLLICTLLVTQTMAIFFTGSELA